jgi:rhodanese-related sulfurtransferase
VIKNFLEPMGSMCANRPQGLKIKTRLCPHTCALVVFSTETFMKTIYFAIAFAAASLSAQAQSIPNKLREPANQSAPMTLTGAKTVTTNDLEQLFGENNTPSFFETAEPAVAERGPLTENEKKQLVAALSRFGKNDPVVIATMGNNTWRSYYGAQLAVKSGFTNVLWYRDGVTAWFAAHPAGGDQNPSGLDEFQRTTQRLTSGVTEKLDAVFKALVK